MRKYHALLSIIAALSAGLTAPEAGISQSKPVTGIRENTPRVHALIHARIVQEPERIIEDGTIVLRDGYIAAVGAHVRPPADARIWDYSGLTVYPGFIEPCSQLGLPKKPDSVEKKTTKGTGYWNPYVRPETKIAATLEVKAEDLEKMRKQGFTAAVIAPETGIFTGASLLVSLSSGKLNENLLQTNLTQNIIFARPGRRNRSYPNSQMGVIALIRQTLLDAAWYQKAQRAYAVNPTRQKRPQYNSSLQVLAEALQTKQVFAIKSKNDLNTLRALKIIREFGLNAWLIGNGEEYRHLAALKKSRVPMIIPLNFPQAPAVDSPEEALNVSLRELNHWETAPANARFVNKAGIPFAFTTSGLTNPADFRKNIIRAITQGLPKETALAALTMVPATVLGIDQQLGSIDRGKLAHLLVTDGDFFDSKSTLCSVWINGQHHSITQVPVADPRGSWSLSLEIPGDVRQSKLSLTGKPEKLNGILSIDSLKIKLKKAALDIRRITLLIPGDSLGYGGIIRLSGEVLKNRLAGAGLLPDGQRFQWQARRTAGNDEPEKKRTTGKIAGKITKSIPHDSYSYGKLPVQAPVIFVKGGTIWTSGPKGRIEADMLIIRGKIAQVGKNIVVPANAKTIDATDKHITPGLIDAHSHSGIHQGVNESSQAVTAEVRVADVIDPGAIALYRELAGGLTIINQLHGSANPIGGQNSVIKLRWGGDAQALRLKDAQPGIKFALGENVKQSNRGDKFTSRYPQTRMGVEQIIFDRFKAARDYESAWTTYNALKNKIGVIPPRRDLELETLLEILQGKRAIHCHAYRQDEILMLVRIADYFGFKIGAFQHVLEGYKVADILAKHGAGASTFSDWWAYKFEVYDAIPYNGAIMHNAGVVVSFNSDDAELARRMNLEAAKAVKYGGLAEEEALKFATLYPAKQLHIDHRVGSLEKGKDGDFVVWSGHPLSTFSRCEQTWIEGRKYFDLVQDLEMQKNIEKERARIIQKILTTGAKSKQPKGKN